MIVINSEKRVEVMWSDSLGLSLRNDGTPAKDIVNMQECFPGAAVII